jgi:hypothetical protein
MAFLIVIVGRDISGTVWEPSVLGTVTPPHLFLPFLLYAYEIYTYIISLKIILQHIMMAIFV